MARLGTLASRPLSYLKDEKTEFPILCETCLGPNPYIRMSRAEMDKECKICTRPFTVFRWRPGKDARYKKTEICQTCSKLKNVCQTCLFDLEFGLPVQVRDTFAPASEAVLVPQSEVSREWLVQQTERRFASGEDSVYATIPHGKAAPGSNDEQTMNKLARFSPYYKRNRPHVCSFYVKGECSRGEECPYRHEIEEENELSHQNIKDRFYGVNDPVAKKIMRLHQEALEAKEKKEAMHEESKNNGNSTSSSSSSVPLPSGPQPTTTANNAACSYYLPPPPAGSLNSAQAYASQMDSWLGPAKV